jgi:hypothetical protein
MKPRLEKGEILLGLLSLAILLAGILRFVKLGHFTLAQAFYCLLSIPVAMLLLLISDYTLHHARIAFLMVLAILALLAIGSPSFCVGLGLAGMLLMQRRN